MYGLLVENLASFIRIQWGEGKWDMVRKNTGVDAPSFSIHHVYPETLLNRLARSAFQVLQVEEKQFFEAMGVYFVEYVGQYGYDAMLTVLGRHMRDFLNGLDNLHEYLKFSYTKMRAPSFYCDSETATGLRLHYRSRRRGFVYYVMGQIKQVGKHFYNQDIEISVISESLDGETMHTIFQLTFDNDAFSEAESIKSMIREEQQLPIRASIIFELFPFCIVFTPEMHIKFTGHALLTILKDLVGQCMTEAFELVKPLISFCFTTILERRNNIFELITVAPIKDDEALTGSFENESEEESGTSLRLRGQMMHMEEWNMMLFLANPVMPDLTSLVEAGLYINDLSLHDCSRDLVLAGTQQSVELKLALDQEQQKSKKLEESMKKLDEEMRRTDELLYQMIPKQVADRLRSGENPVDTCEVFDSVSILFSDVVTFTDICSRITPMQVVSMLNHMYSLFDQLTERNGVYKVETIGDSYMVVSGAPLKDENHPERICDMAMDMVDATQAIMDPSRDDEHLKIRVGCHSGTVVAGVVGVKMPRYCLFGDAVNTASRMESTSTGGRIQISQGCKERLPTPYLTEKRGTVTVKGKGEMDTYWLLGRDARVPLSKVNTNSFNWTAPVSSAALAQKASEAKAAELAKQASIAVEEGKANPAAAELVKDNDTKIKLSDTKERNKLVRQQSTVKISSLASMKMKTTLRTNEPKPSFNEPIEIKGEAAQANDQIIKPTVENPSAFASRQSSVSTPNPTLTSVTPSVEAKQNSSNGTSVSLVKKVINASRSSSPLRDLVRSVSPTPNLVPWLKSGSDTPKGNPSPSPTNPPISLQIPNDQTNGNSGRRSSTPKIIETQYGTKILKFEAEEPPANPVPRNPDIPSPNIPDPKPLMNGIEDGNLPRSVDTLSPNDIPQINADPESVDRGKGRGEERRKSVFIDGINGIRKGSQEFRNKIRDKNLSTATVEAMTDVGCSEFAAKQKEIISRACNVL